MLPWLLVTRTSAVRHAGAQLDPGYRSVCNHSTQPLRRGTRRQHDRV